MAKVQCKADHKKVKAGKPKEVEGYKVWQCSECKAILRREKIVEPEAKE